LVSIRILVVAARSHALESPECETRPDRPDPSIDRTIKSQLRCLLVAAHVERRGPRWLH